MLEASQTCIKKLKGKLQVVITVSKYTSNNTKDQKFKLHLSLKESMLNKHLRLQTQTCTPISLGSFGPLIYSSKEESDRGNVLCEQQQ